jgi:hypothetical protein
VRNVSGTYQDLGFLAWDITPKSTSGADTDPESFSDKAVALVDSAGENGCDLESTLEAWYRFLVDPEPPADIMVPADSAVAVVTAVDDSLIAQREAFLRPDSLVIIGMLSDENDCSIIDEGYGWLAARSAAMYRSNSACAASPNDPCCASCAEATQKPGCPSNATDPLCADAMLAAADDSPSLRCWHQKSRFGFDLLYPISRYVEGLSSALVPQRSTGNLVNNPLFAATGGKAPRDRGLVQLLGIVGVPWQDIADADSLSGPGLRYLTPSELESNSRWNVLLGDPEADPPVPPTDPLMIEDTAERTGTSPVTDFSPAPSTSLPTTNPINGHEHANVANDDLQYACIFPLAKPRTCDAAAEAAGIGCDCFEADAAAKRPVCQSPDGTSGTTQYYAKAYPGTRFLQLFKGVSGGSEPVIASICPKELDPESPDYGYLPAMNALVSAVRPLMRERCLPAPLPVNDQDGKVEGCGVVAADVREGAECGCSSHGWTELKSGAAATAARIQLKNIQACGAPGTPSCNEICLCGVPQLDGTALVQCQVDLTPPDASGYCYVNGQLNEPNVGNPELLRNCDPADRRLLRFVGETPSDAYPTFLICNESLVPAP